MRNIIIAVVALLLLIGGGVGAYFFFFNGPAVAADGGEVGDMAALDEHDMSEEYAEGGHGEEGTAHFNQKIVKLDPLILPIIDNNGVSQVVTLMVSIEAAGFMSVNEINAQAPRLQSAFLQDMYGLFYEKAVRQGGTIRASQIKKRLHHIATQFIEEKNIKQIVIEVAQQRPV